VLGAALLDWCEEGLDSGDWLSIRPDGKRREARRRRYQSSSDASSLGMIKMPAAAASHLWQNLVSQLSAFEVVGGGGSDIPYGEKS
jgi:hypothetical protein